MLLLDRRVGSGHYLEPLTLLNIPAELSTLDFADAAFLGNGPEGDHTVQIGIEIKKIHDYISSIETGRLAGHQLPGLVKQYDMVWLIIEGLWRSSPDGLLEIHRHGKWTALEHGKRRYMYREIDNFTTTLEVKAGLHVRRTADERETVAVLSNLFRWWTAKTWEQHRSHLSLHRPADTAMLVPPPLRRRIAIELPGVGHERSADVAKHFGTTLELVNADEAEWRKVPGIGKTLAARIVGAIGRE